MSEIISVTGVVSGARVDSNLSINNTTTVNNNGYSPTATTTTETVVNKSMVFRVDNRPANFSVAINLTDGDMVTAAGFQKGELEILALHNHTTRTLYTVPGPNTVAPIIYIVIGILTIGLYGIGYILIIGGVWFLAAANKRKSQIAQASALAKNTQAPK